MQAHKVRVLAVTLFFLLGSLCVAEIAATAPGTLSPEDCVKCHEKEAATIAESGGKHKSEVSCIDCHEEHPPSGKNSIPQCSKCHQGRSHFSLENCLGCHSNPHNPLGLKLIDGITAPCLTCHEEQGREFKEYPSRHSAKSCTFCHTVHGLIPQCFQCHEPHVEGQAIPDCLGCHPVHRPLDIVYEITTPRRVCIPCHQEQGEELKKTTIKHRKFTCAYCHRGPHPSRVSCRICHAEPHSQKMHQMIPVCIDCHLDNHNVEK